MLSHRSRSVRSRTRWGYCSAIQTATSRMVRRRMISEKSSGSGMLLIEDAPLNIAAAAEQGLGTVGVYEAVMAAWQEDIRRTADVYLRDFSDLSALRALLQMP